MTLFPRDEASPADEAFSRHLAELDDALASGRLSEGPVRSAGHEELARRLADAGEVLRRLHQEWPRTGGGEPTAGNESSPVAGAAPGGRLGRFEIRRELGRGGWGIVYLAYDTVSGRQVALKVPRPEVLVNPPLKERFLREGRSAGRLKHPNVVAVHEVGEVGPICYIASAYCHGVTLAEWLKTREDPVPPPLAAALVRQVAEAIAHAHSHRVLHRDLKPSNIILQFPESQDGESAQVPFPVLTDFGLAKQEDDSPNAGARTRTGVILGTPHYMAPEQAAGRRDRFGPAMDVYSLGVILYEILTGRPPFADTAGDEVLERVLDEEPTPPRRLRRDVPPALEAVCLKCLAKEPDERYPSAEELADDLDRVLAGESIRRDLGRSGKFLGWLRRLLRRQH